MAIGNKFQSLTNVRKNSNYLFGGDSRYPSLDTVKLGNTLKNMGSVLAKIVKRSIFSKMKFVQKSTKKHQKVLKTSKWKKVTFLR